MQLTDDEIKGIAETCSDGTDDLMEPTWSINAMIKFAHAIESALSAQADARPVAWYDRATGNVYPLLGEGERYAAGVRQLEPLYTHPEASAPGLSREDSDLLRELLYRVEYDPGSPTEEKLHQAYEIITRGRAATLRLPPTTGLPQAAYCASVATVAEPRKYPLAQGYQSYGDGGDCEQAEPVPYDGLTEQFSDEVSRLANDAPGIREAVAVALGHCGAIIAPAEQQAEPGADERGDAYAGARLLTICQKFGVTVPDGWTWETIDAARFALLGQIRSAIERAAQSGQRVGVAEGWQPIETAPKDGTHILARNDDYAARETYWEFYAEGSLAFRWFKEGKGPSGAWSWPEPQNNWGSSWKPTHWMPLPAAPTQQQEGV